MKTVPSKVWVFMDIHGHLLQDGYGGIKAYNTKQDAVVEYRDYPEDFHGYKLVRISLGGVKK